MRCRRVQALPGSSLMAVMEASLDQRWRFRGNDPPRKQRKTLLTIMTSTFKWIVVHVLKSKLGYGRSWQTFSSAGRPCFCSCFSLRDSADNSIVAPELDYRRRWFLNEQEGQIKKAHIRVETQQNYKHKANLLLWLRQHSASSSVVTVLCQPTNMLQNQKPTEWKREFLLPPSEWMISSLSDLMTSIYLLYYR